MSNDAPASRRILVVDDSTSVRYTVVNFIKRLGYEVLEAEDGKQALEVVEAESPDLVILDIHMPQMGGLDVLRTMRAYDRFKDIPVIVLTASADMKLVRQAAALQISGYLVKSSLSAGEVRKRISAIFSTPAAAPAPTRRLSSSLSVLLADNNEQQQQLLLGLLKKWGCLVEAVDSVAELLTAFKGGAGVDLILMNENLHDETGFAAAAAIRDREQDEGAERTPIILLSSQSREDVRSSAQEAGVDAYVGKPVDPGKLFQTLEGMASVDVALADTGPTDAGEVFDGEELLERVDGDVELLQRMTALYIRDYGDLLDRIRKGVAGKDAKEVHDATHTLKGMLGNLSARRGYAIAQELEGMAMEDSEKMEEALGRLQEQSEQLSRGLTAFVVALKES